MTIHRPVPLTVSSRRFPAPRGFVADLVGLTRDIPLFPVTRSMHLAPVAEARAAAADRIGWAAIVLKAYGRVAAEMPILRTWIVRGIVPRLATSFSVGCRILTPAPFPTSKGFSTAWARSRSRRSSSGSSSSSRCPAPSAAPRSGGT
jgi:hypothetical protein